MNEQRRQSGPRRSANDTLGRVLLCSVSLLLGLGLILVSARPAQGRWLTPESVGRGDLARVSPEEVLEAQLAPEPTPAPLPEQARVPVLMYHYISELPPDADRYRVDLTVLPENFRAQLQYLADRGYHTVSLTDLYEHLTQGAPLPEKPVVLTFDDGYRDAYEVAFPMLLEYGFSGTFFVLATPAHYEWESYLTWAQMKEMADAGMEIQAHGRDHVDLRGRSYDYLVYQILGAREAIEYHTGHPAVFFCYPSGRYDANVVAVLKSAGYLGAVTTKWGATHTREGLYEMPRIRIHGSTTLRQFASYLEE